MASKIGKNQTKRMTKFFFSKKNFFLEEKMGKNVIFEAKIKLVRKCLNNNMNYSKYQFSKKNFFSKKKIFNQLTWTKKIFGPKKFFLSLIHQNDGLDALITML